MAPNRNNCINFVKVGSGALSLLSLACITASHLGYRINSPPSLPEGIWKVDPMTRPIQRGKIVSISPVDTAVFHTALSRNYLSWGLFPGGFSSLLKPVAAVPGDQVRVSAEGITVNGALLSNSQATNKDSSGRHFAPSAGRLLYRQTGNRLACFQPPAEFRQPIFRSAAQRKYLGQSETYLDRRSRVMIPSIDMLQQYAHSVAPETIAAIVQVESGGNKYALGVNGPVKGRIRPTSVKEAAAEARYWISKGYSVDLGLMQINSRNLRGLAITIEEAFDPVVNIQAGAKILLRGYRGATQRYGPGQNALKAALSAYNTGNYEKGFKNGYVAKYFPASGIKCGIYPVAIKEPHSGNNLVSISSKNVPSISGLINRYKTELTIYKQDDLPKVVTSQEVSPLDAPCAGLSISELPTEQ